MFTILYTQSIILHSVDILRLELHTYLLKNHIEIANGTLTDMNKIKKVLQDWEQGIIYVELKF